LRRPTRLPAPVRTIVALAGTVGLLLGAVGPASAATGLTLSTPYPAVAVAPGDTVTFDLNIGVTEDRTVELAVGFVPTGWTTTLRGGGNVIDAVRATVTNPPSVSLDVAVPAGTPDGSTTITVTAHSGSLTDALPLTIRVNSNASGQVTMTSDFPQLQGPASQTFSFTLTLKNDTAEDLTFALSAQGPAGWTVTANPSGETQATSTTVKAGQTTTIAVSATPSTGAQAGPYQIDVKADSGTHSTDTQLEVDVTGDFSMTLTTPDQRLNASGNAGSAITAVITVQNTGSGQLTGVKPTATAPSNWTVTFDPPTVDVAPNQSVNVTSTITPASDAIAGDYVVSYRAATTDSSTNATMDMRVTIQTSLTWALVGIALILVTLAVLGWVFARYGRR